MEDFSTQPQTRVFRLDTECYILYLGKDGTEYRPFLRIGNTPDFPEELKELVYSIVVTDGITGSPLVEAENLDLAHTSDFRYIGDPKTVERFKRFLKHLEIPSKGYQRYSGDVLEDRGCFVYFYENQNIKVTFDRSELFDLKTREETDKHYPQRAEAIKAAFIRNTLRYTTDDPELAGLLVRNGQLYLFGGGDLASVDLPSEYFRELAERGYDPDRVTVVIADTPSEGLVRLLKRGSRKGGRIRVLTAAAADMQSLVDLFSDGDSLALEATVEDRTVTPTIHLGELTVRTPKALKPAGVGLQFSYRGTEGRVRARPDKRSAGRGTQLILTLEDHGLQMPGGRQFVLFDGVPYQLHSEAPSYSDLVRDYWPTRTNGLGVGLGAAALGQVAAFEDLRTALASDPGSQSSKSAAAEALEAFESVSEQELSAVDRRRMAIATHNVRVLTEIGYSGATPQQRKTFESVLKQLGEPSDHDTVDDDPAAAYLPGVIADLYLGGADPMVLYRPPSPATKTGLQRARDLAKRISAERDPDPTEFRRERERLNRLVDALDREQAVTLPADVQQRIAEQAAAGDESQRRRPLTARERLQQRAAAERERRLTAERDSTKARSAAAAGKAERDEQVRSDEQAQAAGIARPEELREKVTGAGTGSGTAVPSAPPRVQPRRSSAGAGSRWRGVAIAAVLVLMVLAVLLFTGVLSRPMQWVADSFRPVEEPPPEVEPAPPPPAREPDDPVIEEEPVDPEPPEPEPPVDPEPPEPEPPVDDPEAVVEPEPAEPAVRLDPEVLRQRREVLEQTGIDEETQELLLGANGVPVTVLDVWLVANVIA